MGRLDTFCWPLETAAIVPDPAGGFLHVSRAIELDEKRLVALEDRHRPRAVRPQYVLDHRERLPVELLRLVITTLGIRDVRHVGQDKA